MPRYMSFWRGSNAVSMWQSGAGGGMLIGTAFGGAGWGDVAEAQVLRCKGTGTLVQGFLVSDGH